PFYGCYIVRPTRRLGFEFYPQRDEYLEMVIEACGAEPVEYAGSHKCCGFPIVTMHRENSLRQAGRHMADALDAGADCVVTPCPHAPWEVGKKALSPPGLPSRQGKFSRYRAIPRPPQGVIFGGYSED